MTKLQALKARDDIKSQGGRIVFTNGCFDLLHTGHLRYLAEARGLGDFLFVGLNSDASVKRLKGDLRPVRDETERAEMLAALCLVDGVVLFPEDTPLELIVALAPDVLVKGGDWSVSDIVGGPEVLAGGGEVKSLPFSAGYSTTALIERVAKAYRPK
jgi:D-beta-D-heptose 7-phosphate kinase/D-beta-D-heptose 1-phosphate adenosyltransferase